MMRFALFYALIVPAIGFCRDEKKEIPKDLQPFQGAWKVVKAEGGGKGAPTSLPEDVRFSFSGNKMTIVEGKAPAQEGTFSINAAKDPAEIDMINGKNDKIPGIYKFDKDGKLTISFYVRKAGSPRPKKIGEGDAVVIVLEKVKEKAEAKKEIARELAPFQGVWKVTKMEFGGQEPQGGVSDEMLFTFSADKLTVKEGKTGHQEGTYSIDSKKEPAEFDFVTSKGEKLPGIYKFEKDGKLIVNTTATPGGKRPKKFGEANAVLFAMQKVKE